VEPGARGRMLVTGASGFLGGWLMTMAVPSWEVHAVYRKAKYDAHGVHWHRVDLAEEERARRIVLDVQPKVVVHAAAEANLDWCEEHREEAYAANVLATRGIARACDELGARLLYVSTDMVFDGCKGDYRESDPVNPVSWYGRTKVEAEEVVRSLTRDHVVVRTALMFGDPILGGTSFSVWLEERVRTGDAVPLFVDQFRTPLLVQNAARAILELAEREFRGVLHVAGSDKVDRHTFGRLLAEGLALDSSKLRPAKLDSIQFKAPRPRDLSLNISRARSVLRTPLLDLGSAIRELADWRRGGEGLTS